MLMLILEGILRGIEDYFRGDVYSRIDSVSLHCGLVLDLAMGRLR
jgi:hypothetical protein